MFFLFISLRTFLYKLKNQICRSRAFKHKHIFRYSDSRFVYVHFAFTHLHFLFSCHSNQIGEITKHPIILFAMRFIDATIAENVLFLIFPYFFWHSFDMHTWLMYALALRQVSSFYTTFITTIFH